MDYRYAESDEDVLLIYKMISAASFEVALAPVNPDKMLNWVWETAHEGSAYMAVDEGKCVASMGLMAIELGYSDHKILTNRWLYVLPEYRNGIVMMRNLLREAEAIAEAANMTVIVTPTHRSPRLRKDGIYQVADTLRFSPVGKQFALGDFR